MRQRLGLLAVLLSVFCVGCGGKGHSSLTAAGVLETPAAVPAGLADLAPALPPSEPFVAQRMVSSAQVQYNGSQTYALSHSNATVADSKLKLVAPDTGTAAVAAWGAYRFDGAPKEKLDAVGFSSTLFAHPPGQHVFIGISNYLRNRWEWLDAGTSPAKEFKLFDLSGAYVSPGGQTYVLVMAFAGMQFDVNSVYLRYQARQQVSGVVQAYDGTPIPGALVASPAFQQSTLSGNDGKFSLALPSGSWPLVTTKSGYTFYSNPDVLQIGTAAISGVVITGRQNGSHYVPVDPAANRDDTLLSATPADLSSAPFAGTLSATDDPVDCVSFSVAQPGQYVLEQQNTGLDIYFPYLTLYSAVGQEMLSAPSPVAGTVRIPFLCGFAGQQFYARLSCSGGGGAYTLAVSSGSCVELAGVISTVDPTPLNGCVVTATNSVQHDVTQYLTDMDGAFDDPYRAPVSTTVVPTAAAVTFGPAQLTLNLASGPELAANFTGTLASLGDSYEPNGIPNDADAVAVLQLPYDSTAGGEPLSIASGSDPVDFYRVNPPHGAGLKARLTTLSDHAAEGGVSLSIVDNNGYTTLATGYRAGNSIEARLPSLTQGSGYYIRVAGESFSIRRHAYTLKIDSYVAEPLTFQVKFGQKVVPGAQIQLRQPADAAAPQAYFVHTLTTNYMGITPVQYYAPGEQVQAELIRYGFNTDRYTQAVTMPGSQLLVAFTADPALSLDSLEPNDTLASAAPLALPGVVNGSLDPATDLVDYYRISLDSTDPLLINLSQTQAQAVKFHFVLWDDAGKDYSRTDAWAGGPTAILTAPPDPGEYILEMDHTAVAGTYHLDLHTGPVYHLKGIVTNGNPLDNLTVHCAQLQKTLTFGTTAASAYDFGLVAPGTYFVEAYTKGGICTPSGAGVTLVNSDGGPNFSVTTNYVDGLEPNGGKDDPVPMLPTDGTPTTGLSVGSLLEGGDSADLYGIDVTSGQLVTIRATRDKDWWPGLVMFIYDPAQHHVLDTKVVNGATQVLTFIAPTTGTLQIEVGGGPTEYALDVTVHN